MTTEYIYGLFCPVAKELRYVGRTNELDVRFRDHLRRGRKLEFKPCDTELWINELHQQGLTPLMMVLASGSHEQVVELEKTFVKTLRPNAYLLNGAI